MDNECINIKLERMLTDGFELTQFFECYNYLLDVPEIEIYIKNKETCDLYSFVLNKLDTYNEEERFIDKIKMKLNQVGDFNFVWTDQGDLEPRDKNLNLSIDEGLRND